MEWLAVIGGGLAVAAILAKLRQAPATPDDGPGPRVIARVVDPHEELSEERILELYQDKMAASARKLAFEREHKRLLEVEAGQVKMPWSTAAPAPKP